MRLNPAASASLHRVGRRAVYTGRRAASNLSWVYRARALTRIPLRRAGSLAEATYTENRVAVRRARRKPRQRGNAAWPTSWSHGDVHAAGGEGRGEEVARDWANECATYWGSSLVGKTASGGENPRAIPPQSMGAEGGGGPAVLPSRQTAVPLAAATPTVFSTIEWRRHCKV